MPGGAASTAGMALTTRAAPAAMADRVVHFADGRVREVTTNEHPASPEDIAW